MLRWVDVAAAAGAAIEGTDMPRRAKVERRIPAPDARFQSEVLARFINKVMERGKKGTAERIVYGALDRIADRTGRPPLEVFEQAL
ncbi:MAG TPA: hypothetical protein VK356_07870, partial [Thermomicrobiales bacterium]|nr:hypothetical protein [Thermomicrobiales bacterium]